MPRKSADKRDLRCRFFAILPGFFPSIPWHNSCDDRRGDRTIREAGERIAPSRDGDVDLRARIGFVPLLDEVIRLVRSGGKRLRPAFCFWGYRAAGGEDDEAILRVGAGLELFHTFALIHDDVMDEGAERRGAPTIHVRMAEWRGGTPDAERFGVSSAILAGDFAMVLADHLFLHAGFPPELLAAVRRC